jgi:hypothetical protein
MRILIVGSSTETNPPANFQTACRDIGAALARGGHTIIIGSDGPQTADRYVAEGANSVGGKHDVIVYRPPEQEPLHDPGESDVPFANEIALFPNLNFQYKFRPGSWAVAHTAGIREADAAIIIGGKRSSELVGQIAPILGKPVLALPMFGGAGQSIWNNLEGVYGFSDKQKQQLLVRGQDSLGNTVEGLIRDLARKRLFTDSQGSVLVVCAGLLACMILWVGVFLIGNRGIIDPTAAVFLLLALSALMGTGLRVTVGVLNDPVYKVETLKIAAEATTALLLSLGFVLLYYVGSYVLLGELKEPTPPKDFHRTAVTLSLVAMAVSYLLERSTRVFSERIADRVFGRHP